MKKCAKSANDYKRTVSCLNCPMLAQVSWRDLNADSLKSLDTSKIVRTHKKGEFIFHQGDDGDGIWCVYSGFLLMSNVSKNGNERVVRIVTKGETIGARSFFSGEKHTLSAKAILETTTCYLRRGVVNELIDSHPAVALQFLHTISVKLRLAQEKTQQYVTMNVREKISFMVLQLTKQLGSGGRPENSSFHLPLTYKDMANLLGIAPESFSRTVKELSDDGVLEFNKRIVKIPSLSTLRREANINGHAGDLSPENWIVYN